MIDLIIALLIIVGWLFFAVLSIRAHSLYGERSPYGDDFYDRGMAIFIALIGGPFTYLFFWGPLIIIKNINTNKKFTYYLLNPRDSKINKTQLKIDAIQERIKGLNSMLKKTEDESEKEIFNTSIKAAKEEIENLRKSISKYNISTHYW